MSGATIEQVRSFNRTRHAAHRRAAGRVPRPRTAARRVAGRCGRSGRTPVDVVRCAPGWTSTRATSAGCVRSLERDGLVVVEPDAADRRVRTVRLDRRRPRGARAPRPRQRRARRSRSSRRWATRSASGSSRRWRVVERLLTAGLVAVAVEDPTQRRRPGSVSTPTPPSWTPPSTPASTPRVSRLGRPGRASRRRAGLLLVARLRAEPVALRRAEAPARRARGDQASVGRAAAARPSRRRPRRVLAELEAQARQAGAARRPPRHEPRRCTRRRRCTASAGYAEVPAFNDEPYAHHWFEKRACAPGELRAMIWRAKACLPSDEAYARLTLTSKLHVTTPAVARSPPETSDGRRAWPPSRPPTVRGGGLRHGRQGGQGRSAP